MALEWLKTVLGDAYTEDIDKKISEEISKGFVSKKDFDSKNDKVKTLDEKVKTLEKQVGERDKQLEEIKATSGNADALNKKIEELQEENKKANTDLDELEKKHTAELADRDFSSLLDDVLSGEKVKDSKSVKAHLDINVLKESKNQSEDIKAAIAKVKEEHDFLFESGEPIDNPLGPIKNTPPVKGEDEMMRAIMGLEPAKGEK